MLRSLPGRFWILFAMAAMVMFALAFYQDTVVLHLIKTLNIKTNRSYAVNGIFAAAVYLAAALCGMLSGKYINSYMSVMLGFCLMGCGAIIADSHYFNMFILGLSFFVIGYGFVYTNVFYLVGAIFKLSDKRREGSFTLAYTALNVGALIGLALGGVAVQHELFYDSTILVGIVLLVFAVIFLLNSRQLYKDIDDVKLKLAPVVTYILVGIFSIYLCFKYASMLQIYFTIATFVIVAAIFVFAILRLKKNNVEAKRLFLLGALTITSIFYWSAYRMQDNFVLLFIQHHVDRLIHGETIPSPTLLGINPLFILIFGPIFSHLWMRDKFNSANNPILKTSISVLFLGMAFGILALGARMGFPTNMIWVVLFLILLSCSELILGPTSLSMVGQLVEKKDQLIMLGLVKSGMSAAGVISGIAAVKSNDYLSQGSYLMNSYSNIYFVMFLVLFVVSFITYSYKRLYYKWS